MESEHWIDRLSEHLDGDLSAAERAECGAHLAECPRCAGALEELRAVVAQASLLPDLPPGRDLWPGIESRLTPRASRGSRGSRGSRAATAPADGVDDGIIPLRWRRRVAVTIPQLAAAAIALVVFSVGAMWLALGGAAGPDPAVSAGPAGAAGPGGAPQIVFAAAYNQAIAELEVEFDRRRSELDPETVRVVEENLAIIDAAILDAGRALEADPASGFLNTHLANAMRQKVDLLRRVAVIERTES